MNPFTLYNPTKIIFGRGRIADIAREIPGDRRVLITYGGGSVKKNGVLQAVNDALRDHTALEFGGIEPNPTYDTLVRAVELARRERVDFLLAVGGGSVIDGTKFIAAAIPFQGEPWDIVAAGAPVAAATPIGSVLTLPATGSEMNCGAVISRPSIRTKLPFFSPLVFPRFSVLDPATTFTLPPRQVGNGVVDAFVHIMEQYLTWPAQAPIQDRFAESLLLTLIEEGPKALSAPLDYDVRASIMWCATLALNGLIGAGVPQDWATHMIGHEITALHGLDHAQTLAIVLPALMAFKKDKKRAKLLQYAHRVWGLPASGEPDSLIAEAIGKTRAFFESMGVKTRLSDYGIKPGSIPIIADQLRAHGMSALGEHRDITPEAARKILEGCL